MAAQLREAESDVLAYLDFPADHSRAIYSTNAVERVNAELDRRANVVSISRSNASLVRLFTAVHHDQHLARLLNPEGPQLLTNRYNPPTSRERHRI